MKRMVWLLMATVLLCGCVNVTEPVMETVQDPAVEPVAAEPAPVWVWLPEGAAAQTVAENGSCYGWEDCELRVQTLTGGDIRSTLETLTGMAADRLTVMEYKRGELQMYQTVWSMTGEEGVTLGRCLVADDGNYHYCISLLSPETADVEEDYARICASLDLSGRERVDK